MTGPRRSWLFAGLLVLAWAGCRRASDQPPLPADPLEHPISIEVVNNQPLPVEVFVNAAGVNHRLGTVHPGMSAHFEVPPNMIGNGSVELEAWSSASNTPARSGQLLLSPGAIVDFVVARPPYASTATIRP